MMVPQDVVIRKHWASIAWLVYTLKPIRSYKTHSLLLLLVGFHMFCLLQIHFVHPSFVTINKWRIIKNNNFNLQAFQWIILPIHYCRLVYSFCANLQHFLKTWLMVLFTFPQIPHLLNSCDLSVLYSSLNSLFRCPKSKQISTFHPSLTAISLHWQPHLLDLETSHAILSFSSCRFSHLSPNFPVYHSSP